MRALCTNSVCGGVPATYLSSQQSRAEAVAVLRELGKARPTCKLLYVTPEQARMSKRASAIMCLLSCAPHILPSCRSWGLHC